MVGRPRLRVARPSSATTYRQTLACYSQSSPLAARVCSQAAGEFTCSKNVMGFFNSMTHDLDFERRELAEEQEAINATLRSQGRSRRSRSSSNVDSLRYGRCDRRGDGARTSTRHKVLPPPGASRNPESLAEELHLWERHDDAWNDFHIAPPCPLSLETVPWPPCAADVLHFYEKLQSPGEQRLAYRIACRRWHPDKFLQHYGSSVEPQDMPALTLRLTEVFQTIKAQWEAMQGLAKATEKSRER
eukprot:TRINITY_DN27494_c0_g2_i1.p1 TRINITY_DN27494_c0_g2~~TRINITY_DN27494_c0_g2_i1.p1  ORF type:complete len:268 (-),score=34.45 TRINITY_DN27494_c0_g2_i1:34-768(-)